MAKPARRFRRRGEDDDEVLRLAARAEWDGRPPGDVREWLADRGVDV
jgi:hypothetical protein